MTPWGEDNQWRLSKATLALQKKLQQGAKKAEEAAREASKAARVAKDQAQAVMKEPTKGKGKGKGKSSGKGGANSSNAASSNPGPWLCQDPDCLADLKKHNKARGPFSNPAEATVCKHCLAPRGMGQKIKSAEMESSRVALREKVAGKLKNSKAAMDPWSSPAAR